MDEPQNPAPAPTPIPEEKEGESVPESTPAPEAQN